MIIIHAGLCCILKIRTGYVTLCGGCKDELPLAGKDVMVHV